MEQILRREKEIMIKYEYNKNMEWRNHKRGLPEICIKKTHLTGQKLQMCFFILLFANNYN